MALWVLDKELAFPPVSSSQPDGLLAIGGDLSPERLLLAYRKGIFPWYSGDYILWWCPHPRFVLFPHELKINRSTRSFLRKNEQSVPAEKFEFTLNRSFKKVIHHCKKIVRPGQDSTWITDDVETAYIRMHELGYAHSAETWMNGKLVGGLYGIKLGKVFFGESMFSKVSNASRFAFINHVQQLKKEGVELIDCQVYTEYLESFGARMIPRNEFCKKLEALIT